VLADSQVIVVGNRSDEFRQPLHAAKEDQIIVDLARLMDGQDGLVARYEGIGW
jgi:hypothetical protein